MKITIEYTDNEAFSLRETAAKSGLSISEYVRKCSLRNEIFENPKEYLSFEKALKIIDKSLQTLSSNRDFYLQDLFAAEWHLLTQGQRQMLGRQFYRNVLSKKYKNVLFIEKKSGGKALYKKV